MLETAWQDVRYGLRLLRRSPMFTATAALSLAIGIGANTTIIINEVMARSVWGTTDVLGRQFEAQVLGDTKTTLTVVGVAPDAQVDTLGAEVRPFVYVPVAQRFMGRVSLLVKSTSGGVIPQVRGLVRELNPNLPITTAMPLEQ